MVFTYGSVCSGIESVSVAWKGFAKPLWFAEIEAFPSAVLQHHYPDVPNLGDFTKIKDKILAREIEAPDVLVGGTPCQAFSFAGKRKSLSDERGKLSLAFIELANAIDYVRKIDGKEPVIILWENVPGVFSTKDNAFGYFTAGLVGESEPLQPPRKKWTSIGYVCGKREIAWKVLDSRYFGVPQRRKRVFLIASSRRGCAPEILFKRYNGEMGNQKNRKVQWGKFRFFCESGFGKYLESHTAPTLRASLAKNVFVYHNNTKILRVLTPREFERLQGFPDDYTLVPYRNKFSLDSHRYKALGNTMTVNVMKYLGKKIYHYIFNKS